MLKTKLIEHLESIADRGYAMSLHNQTEISSSYPQEWMTEYVAKNLSKVDPTIRWCSENVGMTSWADIPNMRDDEKTFMIEAAKMGYEFGSVYSIMHKGLSSILAVCHSSPTIPQEQHTEILAILRALAIITPSPEQYSISTNSRVYLEMAANGAPDKEIAVQLNKSPRTIAVYRKAALAELKSKSLAEAVARAAMLGYVGT